VRQSSGDRSDYAEYKIFCNDDGVVVNPQFEVEGGGLTGGQEGNLGGSQKGYAAKN